MTAEQFAPVELISKAGKKMMVDTFEEYTEMIAAGWKDNSISPPSATKSTTGKRRLSKAQAQAIADANLSESLGMPSTLAAQPIGFTFQAKVVDFIEQPKRSGNGKFVSTQIDYNGTKFCILFDAQHDINLVLNCRLADAGLRPDGTPVTRSGKTVEVIY